MGENDQIPFLGGRPFDQGALPWLIHPRRQNSDCAAVRVSVTVSWYNIANISVPRELNAISRHIVASSVYQEKLLGYPMLSALMQYPHAVVVLTTVQFKLPVEVVDSKICDGSCQLPSVGQNRMPSSHFCHRGEATLG